MAPDFDRLRDDFPILKIAVHGKPFVYLDSAATSQKPNKVIDAISEFYRAYNANINRGVYEISEKSTEAYIESKSKVARLINAKGMEEVVYVRNTTEAINLVSLSWGEKNIGRGDHILITEMEHHSNMVPWQILAKKKGAVLDYVALDADKTKLDIESLKSNLEKKPKIVSVTHVSNVLGTVNDVAYITKLAHENGAVVLVDGAQSAPHMKVDVKAIGCDFFAFSGHKMLAPTGIGTLYGKAELLDQMQPIFGGGDMIKTVEKQSATWNDLPWKFEAGTSNIEGGIAFGVAVDYLEGIGMENIDDHEKELTSYALEKLSSINDVAVFGPGRDEIGIKTGLISFAIKGVHPHDIASIFDSEGVAIRAGHHCAMPLVVTLAPEKAVSRMSFYLYNNMADIDRAVQAIERVRKIFKRK